MVALNDPRPVAERAVLLPVPAPGPALLARLRSYLPQGNLLDDEAWLKRHRLLEWLLLLHLPGIALYGLSRGYLPVTVLSVCAPIAACLAFGHLVQRRRIASFFVTAGLVYCSSALVGLSGGVIEAHFHFFILIGFIALYQDWIPFLWMIVFTVFGHGLGSAWSGTLIFNHASAQQNPWLWSLIHGVAVLAACVGMVIFWRYSEDEMTKSISLRTRIAESEIERRRFTSDLLVNLARRNQSMLHLQLGIINQLEEAERDPDALADLFKLDHLATRIRRNAESLLVLSGEEPPRVWSQPVRLRDVVRAAIAETEDLDRVDYEIEDDLSVHGRLVTGLTHLLAELVENAVHFSPPQTRVTVRARPDRRVPGAQVITVEDLGLGMPAEDLAAANVILSDPPDVDLSTSQRYGLHVVSRLAQRLDIGVHLTPTANSGLTAVIVLPGTLFVAPDLRPELALAYSATRPPETSASPIRAFPAPAVAQAPALPVAAPRVSANGYPATNGHRTNGYHPAPVHPAPVHPAPDYPDAEYRATEYPATEYRATEYPPPAYLDADPVQPPATRPLPTRPAGLAPLPPLTAAVPAAEAPGTGPVSEGTDQPADPPLEKAYEKPYEKPFEAPVEQPTVNFGVDVDLRDEGWKGWWGDRDQHHELVDGTPTVVDLRRIEARQPEPDGDWPIVERAPGITRIPGATRPPAATTGRTPARETPSAPPVPRLASSDPAEPALSHRTPQTHLAPELRRRSAELPAPAPVDPDALSARDALSAYQARRQAALSGGSSSNGGGDDLRSGGRSESAR